MDKSTEAMLNILKKVNAVENTTKIVAERANNDVDLQMAITQKVTENSISVQNYRIDIVLLPFASKQKRFYNIVEDEKIIHRELALFETAMGIVKNLMLGKQQRVTELEKLDVEYNNSLYEVYMFKTKAKKSINEDVMIAKMSQAQNKLYDTKNKILQKL